MNAYQQEQLEALRIVRQGLARLSTSGRRRLDHEIEPYCRFRTSVDIFLDRYLKGICTRLCYRSRTSACCSRDGIIAFFADVVINALTAEKEELDRLEKAIQHPSNEGKCIFLAESGCLWRIKPVVCEMFLCDEAENRVFGKDPGVLNQWVAFKEEKKRFTWPDQPVLFEKLEAFFMASGCSSSLMYIHKSPGLMRIKENREK